MVGAMSTPRPVTTSSPDRASHGPESPDHEPARSPRHRRSPGALATRLDDEWRTLRRSRRSLHRAATWRTPAGTHPLDRILADLDDLDTIIHATHRDVSPPSVGDAIMVRLVELARSDELACRLVVQRLLPGLISRARSYRTFGRPTDLLEIVVPVACMCILRHDVERRPRHVAATLISDAVYHAFRQPLRRHASTEVVCAPSRFADTCADVEPDALAMLAETVRDAREAGVTDEDLDLIRELAATGSTTIVAARRNVTSRTIRNHRGRAMANIRHALGLAA
jgi:hypothetical protein